MELHHTVEMTLLTMSLCLSPPSLFPFVYFLFPPCLTLFLHQAIPSHGFHQFKSNSLDVLQRRIEELQVCPSVCPSVMSPVRYSPGLRPLSTKCMIRRVLDSVPCL